MKKSRFTDNQILAILKQNEAGTPVPELCLEHGISEPCYRYQAKLSDENAVIADRLIRLTYNWKDWSFRLCFLFLRNVKGYSWNHKRVYRINKSLS